MHMILGLTLMHDSALAHTSTRSLSLQNASLRHWSHATTQYQRLLSGPIPPSQRDAIWATGVHLGAASFWYLESDDPHAVWPLKPSEPGDLAWMKIGEGKRHLWRIADPTREDSVFNRILKKKTGPCPTPPEWMVSNDTSLVPEKVRLVFGVTEESNRDNNVYHFPVLILSRIQHLRLSHGNVLDFLYFTAFLTPEFLALLEQKDPKAVFLLGWWFSMCRDGTLWWVTRRARVEGEAVRIWLGRTDKRLLDLLEELSKRRVNVLEERFWVMERVVDEDGFETNWALDSRGRILTVAN
ncbi:uncharacterized protein J4E87_001170 [Alternaria ethzedia]|uniref:uncharacterized protein n=1 Tax=Alternaria ethzedia TaxID=181014 RepID=UPI0020C599CC|nr:uncharacterized protein J4E87_001170 [Alternaria ethzedia]KAI4634001.1 hypothetical protein J4E87_001170 [Alternaria ethzedia]